MNRLDYTQTGGYNMFTDRDLKYADDSLRAGVNATMQAMAEFCGQDVFIISGCQFDTNDDEATPLTTCSAGWIYFQGEVMQVPSHTISGSRPLYFVLFEAAESTDPVLMADGSNKNIHKKRYCNLLASLGSGVAISTTSTANVRRYKWLTHDMSHQPLVPFAVPSAINSKFDSGTGLGKTGLWKGYARCDGQNGTLDLQGYVIGMKKGSGAFNVTLDTPIGEETHTLTIPEIPAHHHGGVVSTAGASQSIPGGTDHVDGNTADTGGGGAHNNIQPTMVMTFICRLVNGAGN